MISTVVLLALLPSTLSQSLQASSLASLYSLPTSTSLPPSSPTTTGNVDNNSTFLSMMVSYEVAFDEGFNWVKGRKLLGLRGGPKPDGCSGGAAVGDGSDCFSTRLVWRDGGAGEVYTYIPTSNCICGASSIICNPDFGTSISRGSFSFAGGQWNRITMLVQQNDPANVANVSLSPSSPSRLCYTHHHPTPRIQCYNDVHALSQTGFQIRAEVTAGGFCNDSSYATPQTTHTYFRNFNSWASIAPSNLTGTKVRSSNGGIGGRGNEIEMGILVGVAVAVGAAILILSAVGIAVLVLVAVGVALLVLVAVALVSGF
ncbi:polysaccharide lyase family 14 protein [Jaapia argillacea MUCL 33604]|uniref:Polysaccharide lyase family 14 protein n=1 Tax=Jaapia argillacea MUCL 33604 TaxID=933084 RepID=A0A067PQB1_9AGAM|nr:polysaccharide lyase family 14 protein [Jaapia argillacea MUCL 33604]